MVGRGRGRGRGRGALAALLLGSGLIAQATTAYAAAVSDDFNRADSTDLGSGWTEVATGLSIQANRLAGVPGALAVAVGGSGNRVTASLEDVASDASPSYVALVLGYQSLSDMVFVRLADTDGNTVFDTLTVLRGNDAGSVVGEREVLNHATGQMTATLTGSSLLVRLDNFVTENHVFDLGSPPSGTGVGVTAAGSARIDDFASSAVTASQPTISVTTYSDDPISAYGWYRGPVYNDYTCAEDGTPIVDCPTGDQFSEEGANRTITHTIHAEDGGTDSVTITVDLDLTLPSATLKGIQKAPYLESPKKTAKCVGSDAVSGVASCVIEVFDLGGGRLLVDALVTDKAGWQDLDEAEVRTATVGLLKASYAKGRYVVTRGKRYTVVVLGKAQPSFVGFLGRTARPTAFVRKNGRWELGVTIPKGLTLGKEGIRIRRGSRTTTLGITVAS